MRASGGSRGLGLAMARADLGKIARLALAPGFVATEMTREFDETQRQQISRRSALKRMADPIDVARSVEFLFGDGGRKTARR